MTCLTGYDTNDYSADGYAQEWHVSLNFLIPPSELVSVPFSYENEYEGGEYSGGQYFFLPFTPAIDPETGCAELYTGRYTSIRVPYDDNDQDIYTTYEYTSSVYTNSYQLPTILKTENWPGVSYSEPYYTDPYYVFTRVYGGLLVGFGIERIHLYDRVRDWKNKFNEIVLNISVYAGVIPWTVHQTYLFDGNRLIFSDVVAEYTNKFGEQSVQDRIILKSMDDQYYDLGQLDDDPIELFRQTPFNQVHTDDTLNSLVGICPYRTEPYEQHFAGTTREVE